MIGDLLTLPNAIAAVIAVSLTAYSLLGGADFGGGVWDLLASGPRRQAQRALVADAIGPIWEANHVWLILVVVLLFTCFPAAFAALSTVLHIPLTLMLIGIVLRGSAFTFRTYDSRRDSVQRRWGVIFAVASLVTPVLLGVCVGAIATGRVGEVLRATAACAGAGLARERTSCLAREGLASFFDAYAAPWLTPFAFAVGMLTLALFAYLAAVYLTVEARDAGVREDFRARALAAALGVFVAAFAALLLAPSQAPLVGQGLVLSAWAPPLHIATGAAAVGAIWALWTRRYRVARLAAAAQVSLIVWGWAVAQFPYLIPPAMTISGAAAPPVTLRLVLWALAGGALLLLPSLVYLFRVFKGAGSAFERVNTGR